MTGKLACSALLLASLLLAQGGCREVVDVLQAAGGAGNAAAGTSGVAGGNGSGGSAVAGGGASAGNTPAAEGGEAAGGAKPADPTLGVFVDAGDAHACAARHGILYCWGKNTDGQLGVGDNTDRVQPTRVGLDADWVMVATGVAHSCALKSDGSVWCFGKSTEGQLGQGSLTPSNVPLRVPLPDKVRQLSSEARTVCSVLESGALFCWGYNVEGGIGLNDLHPGDNQLSPVRSGEQSDWKITATGDGHSCGVRGAGLLFGWGRNTAANLGLGQVNDPQRRVAVQIGTDEDWLDVVAGQDSSCGLREGGNLFCWGGNAFGNLGLGDLAQRLAPTPVVAGRVWTQIAIDTFHACGLDAEQNLYCWGRAIEGQLGTGRLDALTSPELIGTAYVQVAVGRMSTCAVGAGGAVRCTGENAAGQLGVGDSARRNVLTDLMFPEPAF